MITRHRPHRRAELLLVFGVSLLPLAAACSSDDASTGSGPAAAGDPTSTPSAASTPGGATTPITESSTPGQPASSDDVCSTLPSLETINAQLDEPVTGIRELDRGPGYALCEAAGDGVANVSFTRLQDSTREQAIALAEELGATVTELNDPALPGAIAYSGSVSVFIDNTEYTVQAITLDTLSAPDSPAAIQRSAVLLVAWLQNLGLS